MEHPMLTLWAAADPAKLTDEVLKKLSYDPESGLQLDNLAMVVEGIGLLGRRRRQQCWQLCQLA